MAPAIECCKKAATTVVVAVSTIKRADEAALDGPARAFSKAHFSRCGSLDRSGMHKTQDHGCCLRLSGNLL